jgi:SET domain-containing protein
MKWAQAGSSGIHGSGVFALADIPDGTRIIEYTGERITKAQSKRREQQRLARQASGDDGCVYIFDVDETHDLDGRRSRSIARLINHSCAPNCTAENIDGHIWIVAKRDIAQGAELTFDYGYPYSDWRLHPCRCGAKGCVGFIVNKPQRWRVKRILREERRR